MPGSDEVRRVREPLTPVSPNRRKERVGRSEMSMDHISSMVKLQAQSNSYSVGLGTSGATVYGTTTCYFPTCNESDDVWLEDFDNGDFTDDEWRRVTAWLEESMGDRRWSKAYPSSHPFDGKEDYSSGTRYGVSRDAMMGLLSGADASFEGFLYAEGQLARMLTLVKGFAQWKRALTMWVLLMSRHIGNTPLFGLVVQVRELPHLGHEDFCPAAQFGFISGAVKFNRNHALIMQAKSEILEEVLTLRTTHIGKHCFNSYVCGLHAKACTQFWRVDSWEDTEADTSDEEDIPTQWS